MKIIKTITKGIDNFISEGNKKYDLNFILSNANPEQSLEERVDWIHKLLIWIRSTQQNSDQFDTKTGQTHSTRVKYILDLLDINLEWKKNVSLTLRSVIKETNSLQLFCHTGLPQEVGFLQEATDRILNKVIPTAPDEKELSELFLRIFPDEEDAIWVENLSKDTIQKIKNLILFESNEKNIWYKLEENIEDAIYILTSQIHAIGLSESFRKRMSSKVIKDSPFIGLSDSVDLFLNNYRKKNIENMKSYSKLYNGYLDVCKECVDEVFQHLEEFGVSVTLVYQLEKITFHLNRLEILLSFLNPTEKKDNIEIIPVFLAKLIRESFERKSILALIQTNLNQLSRKIAERSGKTGEHYITQNKTEYVGMLKSASGGGIVTAMTTWIKFLILSNKFAYFFEGLFASLNYASSFIFIQLMGFTLATKQPSMTAAALAGKLQESFDENSLEEFLDEVAKLTRSQFAAILGNLTLVFPTALLIDYIIFITKGHHFLSNEKAVKTILSHSIIGPSIFYAVLTGFLLWFSSIIAGWLENWSAYRRLPEAIAKNKRLIFVFGKEKTESFSKFFAQNISGFGGNLSLGFLLGMTPSFGRFFGLALDVRHVTLSTGALGFAFAAVDFTTISNIEITLAVLGVITIGFLNVGVSFALAMAVAIRARKVKSLGRKRIRKAILKRLITTPLDFFYPVKKK